MIDDSVSVGSMGSIASLLYKNGVEIDSRDYLSNSTVSFRRGQSGWPRPRSIDGTVKSTESLSFLQEASTVPDGGDSGGQDLVSKSFGKISKPKQKLVSGSQFRNTANLNNQCEQCYIFDRVNKKLKETIRGLRAQIARLEEQNHDLKKIKATENTHQLLMKPNALAVATLSEDVDESNMENIEFLINKCEAYEADMAKIKKLLVYERGLNEGLRKTLDETRTSLRDDLARCTTENNHLRDERMREKEKCDALKATNDENTILILQYKKQLEQKEAKLSECLLKLGNSDYKTASVDHMKELSRLREVLKTTEANLHTVTSQLVDKESELLRTADKLAKAEESNQKLEEKRVEMESLVHRTQNEIKEAQDALHAAKKHAAVAQDTLTTTIKEKDTVSRTLGRTETQLENSNLHNTELRKQNSALSSKISELMNMMAKEAENTKKALEKAITGSVRLCVVAPTVNVHVSDKKLKFKAGQTHLALHKLLSAEVLDKYSFLFKQKNENSAPDGSNLETWLQELLAQMKTSIQQHIDSAMDGSSV